MLERSANRCLVGAGHAELQIPAPLEPIKHIRHAKELFIFANKSRFRAFGTFREGWRGSLLFWRLTGGFASVVLGVLPKIFAHSSILDVAKSRFIALSVDFV
ncbi:MAG: hypothetical protein KAR47_17825 [Planctomycetes bacterium]|nr:hypothetical protein [Planctomycetota bacterium]